jgi:hypothetical protein
VKSSGEKSKIRSPASKDPASGSRTDSDSTKKKRKSLLERNRRSVLAKRYWRSDSDSDQEHPDSSGKSENPEQKVSGKNPEDVTGGSKADENRVEKAVDDAGKSPDKFRIGFCEPDSEATTGTLFKTLHFLCSLCKGPIHYCVWVRVNQRIRFPPPPRLLVTRERNIAESGTLRDVHTLTYPDP